MKHEVLNLIYCIYVYKSKRDKNKYKYISEVTFTTLLNGEKIPVFCGNITNYTGDITKDIKTLQEIARDENYRRVDMDRVKKEPEIPELFKDEPTIQHLLELRISIADKGLGGVVGKEIITIPKHNVHSFEIDTMTKDIVIANFNGYISQLPGLITRFEKIYTNKKKDDTSWLHQ